MCAITGSFSQNKLTDLYRLNAYRGELSYSLSAFSYDEHKVRLETMMQDRDRMPEGLITGLAQGDNKYYIAHSQAPTTNANNIHPAVYGDCMLWHNGIIKQKNLTEGTWDTQWLLEQIINYGWSSLSRVDGTFACIMYNSGELFVFRNEISPMFYDKDLNFSSTKVEFAESLPPNKVFKINLKYKQISPIAYFQTMENPYYIPENA
jgi:asparagine synthetase B (glutamine-hydrolysing)